ncbi:hypothetical protein LPO01_13230 [Ligilactobacillus pobuzihii]|nr:hypothetical protein LPO01_13230 [Ligilactobacillus pobuzihii]
MRYILLFIAAIFLIFGIIFIYLALSKNDEKKGTVLDRSSGTDFFDLLFVLLLGLKWIDKKLHTKYIANIVSLLIGVLLIVFGLFLFIFVTSSFFR